MALEGEMVDAAPTAAERRMIMAKYIDREALVEWLKRIPLKDLSDGRGLCRVIFEDDFKRAIKKIPKGIIVDVAKVRNGRWIDAYPDIEPNPMFMYGICSECGFEQGISKYLNYCPNCGCRMDGGDD